MPSRPPGCTGRDARALARVPSDYLAILMLLSWDCGLFESVRQFPPSFDACPTTRPHHRQASHMQQRLFIVGAKRTPFGAFGGKLKGLP